MTGVSSSKNDTPLTQPPGIEAMGAAEDVPPATSEADVAPDSGPVDQMEDGSEPGWGRFSEGRSASVDPMPPSESEVFGLSDSSADPAQLVEPGVYGSVDLQAHPVRAENAGKAIDAVNQRVASGELPADKADEALLLLFGAMTQNDRSPGAGLPDGHFHNVAGSGDRTGALWLNKEQFGTDTLNDVDGAIEAFLSGNEDFPGVSQMLSDGQSIGDIAEKAGLPTNRDHYREAAPLAASALLGADAAAVEETIASDAGLVDKRTAAEWVPVLENLDMSNKAEVIDTLSQFYEEQFGMNDAQLASLFSQMEVEIGENFQYTTELSSGAQYNGRTDLGNTQPGDGPRFKGRGFLQITGRGNYDRMDDLLSEALGRPINLEANPELAAEPEIAAFITGIGFTGRVPGGDSVDSSRTFTQSRAISRYIPDDLEGPPTYDQAYNARRVVNSTDKAHAIANRTLELYDELAAD